MALIKCSNCGKQTNNEKDNCLWCNKPIDGKLKNIKRKPKKDIQEKKELNSQPDFDKEYKKAFNRLLYGAVALVGCILAILFRPGVIAFAFLLALCFFIYRNAQIYSEGRVLNESEKEKYLKGEFSKLIGTYDKYIDKSGFEIDREITKVDISPPLTNKRKWKVYKTLAGGLGNNKVIIYEKTDKELDLELQHSINNKLR
tara:strand:+ start:109 stop:708 length:600 start_codon:yes stop_codon:yes gene_type:complete